MRLRQRTTWACCLRSLLPPRRPTRRAIKYCFRPILLVTSASHSRQRQNRTSILTSGRERTLERQQTTEHHRVLSLLDQSTHLSQTQSQRLLLRRPSPELSL